MSQSRYRLELQKFKDAYIMQVDCCLVLVNCMHYAPCTKAMQLWQIIWWKRQNILPYYVNYTLCTCIYIHILCMVLQNYYYNYHSSFYTFFYKSFPLDLLCSHPSMFKLTFLLTLALAFHFHFPVSRCWRLEKGKKRFRCFGWLSTVFVPGFTRTIYIYICT